MRQRSVVLSAAQSQLFNYGFQAIQHLSAHKSETGMHVCYRIQDVAITQLSGISGKGSAPFKYIFYISEALPWRTVKLLIKPVAMGEGNLPSESCPPCAPTGSWTESEESWSTAWLGLCCAERARPSWEGSALKPSSTVSMFHTLSLPSEPDVSCHFHHVTALFNSE